MTMRLKLYTLLCISFLLIFTACNQDDDPVPAEKVTRTVLAYPPTICIAIPGRPMRKSCTAWKKLPTMAHSPKVPAI